MTQYCVADRHGVPCPQPCEACDDECRNDPSRWVEAESAVEAARSAGWSEAFIAEMQVAE